MGPRSARPSFFGETLMRTRTPVFLVIAIAFALAAYGTKNARDRIPDPALLRSLKAQLAQNEIDLDLTNLEESFLNGREVFWLGWGVRPQAFNGFISSLQLADDGGTAIEHTFRKSHAMITAQDLVKSIEFLRNFAARIEAAHISSVLESTTLPILRLRYDTRTEYIGGVTLDSALRSFDRALAHVLEKQGSTRTDAQDDFRAILWSFLPESPSLTTLECAMDLPWERFRRLTRMDVNARPTISDKETLDCKAAQLPFFLISASYWVADIMLRRLYTLDEHFEDIGWIGTWKVPESGKERHRVHVRLGRLIDVADNCCSKLGHFRDFSPHLSGLRANLQMLGESPYTNEGITLYEQALAQQRQILRDHIDLWHAHWNEGLTSAVMGRALDVPFGGLLVLEGGKAQERLVFLENREVHAERERLGDAIAEGKDRIAAENSAARRLWPAYDSIMSFCKIMSLVMLFVTVLSATLGLARK